MPFLIDASDKPGQAALRQKVRPEHLEYLNSKVHLLLAAGAKLSDDGATPQGSFYLVDVEDRAAAQQFIDADPYVRNGVFGAVTLTRVRKGYFDFARQPTSVKA
jgi:uncharacterized protein YciI